MRTQSRLALSLAAVMLSSSPAWASQALLFVANHASDTTDVVDEATNQIVQVIRGIEVPHGVGFSPDGAHVYFTSESDWTFDIVDRKTGAVLDRIPLSGHPNNLAITKDGSRAVICIATPPGAIDIIDLANLQRKTIRTDGTQHNIYVTPDGNFSVSGSTRTGVITVLDLKTEKIAWQVKLSAGVRPMAMDVNPDGSTRRIYAQLTRLDGFVAVDFASHKEVARVKFPDSPPIRFGIQERRQDTPSHGIGVAPDNKTLWVTSVFNNAVFVYSLPDLHLMGRVNLPTLTVKGRDPIGALPNWVAFRPDSSRVYIAETALNTVTVIDAKKMKALVDVKVGQVPQRMNTLRLP